MPSSIPRRARFFPFVAIAALSLPVASLRVAHADPPRASRATADVTRVDGTHFKVRRAYLQSLLERARTSGVDVRVVPEQENGHVLGIRLFGVHEGTAAAELGFENGDRLDSVNGIPMVTPERAKDAGAALASADHVTVDVNRRGQALHLFYDIE